MAQPKFPIHTVYFVRHGQCAGNVSGQFLSPEQDVITDYGRKQARALGDCLKDVHFNSKFASTYQRAIETAKEILSKSVNTYPHDLKTDLRIRERDMGDFIGLAAVDVRKIVMAKINETQNLNALEVPGAETVAQYVERIRSFFKDLFEELHSVEISQTILIVSHGLTMRHFLKGMVDTYSDICDVSNWDTKCGAAIKNTALTKFTLEFANQTSGKPLIHFLKINDTEHLSGLEEETETKHAALSEDQKKIIEKIMKIPGAREEISTCAPV